ncbi:MAG TPA: VCBS repeat-containing protein [Opitutaceae bacterium]|nr:VCBS repeat-containing protein [Opitutaceae bacterium]
MPTPKPVSLLVGILAFAALATVAALAFLLLRNPAVPTRSATAANPPRPAPLAYAAQPLGFPVTGNPVITHVALADLDQDGLLDVLVCDAKANAIGWIRQFPRGVFTESIVGDPVQGPAHVTVADLNQDGRPDLLVASMGIVLPNNDRIGKVVVMENLGDGRFRNRVLAEDIARVTDVRPADLNGDGRLDLVVGQFGYAQGEIRWMENLGNWEFRSHSLLEVAGTIMTPVADYDGDGRPDFAALVSQEAEEVHLFQNLGDGKFRDSVAWKARDESWSSSGLEVADLNRDGRPDLVYSNGDGFNTGFTGPAPWHGLQWLENLGDGKFGYHRIGDMPGCYSPVCADVDGDGDTDIVAVSGFNHDNDPSSVWMTAWLNDGRQKFTAVPLAHEPTRLITLAAGDLDGTGVPVLVTGGFHAYAPLTHMSRVTLWRRR